MMDIATHWQAENEVESNTNACPFPSPFHFEVIWPNPLIVGNLFWVVSVTPVVSQHCPNACVREPTTKLANSQY